MARTVVLLLAKDIGHALKLHKYSLIGLGGSLCHSLLARTILDVSDGGYKADVHLHAPQKSRRAQKLVVVVQKHRGVVDGREPQRRNAQFADEPAVRAARENLRLQLQAPKKKTMSHNNHYSPDSQIIRSFLERHPVGIGGVELGDRHLRLLLGVLDGHALSRFPAPLIHGLFPLLDVNGHWYAAIEHRHQFRWYHVFLHASL